MKRCTPDYAYKAEILRNHYDLVREQKLISRAIFIQGDVLDHITGQVMTFQEAEGLDMVLETLPEYQEARKINHASYERASRLRKRIWYLLSLGECVFLTLTFTDEVLNSTSEETRRRYVTRYLKSQSKHYVANIDFGKQFDREHYHAVCLGPIDYSPWHQYGAIKGEKVRFESRSEQRLSKYISKLTNHALKETGKRYALIYSRDLIGRDALEVFAPPALAEDDSASADDVQC